jgi:cyclopropane fatty-acyl-phospholipid synthase-like methyltransferase
MENDNNNYYEIISQSALPYLESDERILKKVFAVLEKKFQLSVHSNQQFCDLGSGNGTVIIYCSLHYDIKSIGIEINSHLVKETQERIEALKQMKKELIPSLEKISLIRGDLFNISLEAFDFIYIFSLPSMQKYLTHVFRTADSETVFISYKYPLRNFPFLHEQCRIKTSLNQREIFTYFYQKS